MKHLKITVRETLEREVWVDANDYEEARKKVWEKYKSKEIVLNKEDFVEVEFI